MYFYVTYIVIIDAFAEITPIARFFNNTFVGCFNFLGKISLYVYLTHFAVLIAALYFMQVISLAVKIVIELSRCATACQGCCSSDSFSKKAVEFPHISIYS